MPHVGSLADSLCRELSSFDPALHSPDDCARLAEQFARASNACSAAAARAVLRASACVKPEEFLANATGSTPHAAREAIAAVASLDDVPETKRALLLSEVSPAQAAAIARAPEHEEELLAMARFGGLGPVKTAARNHVLRKTPPDELHKKQRASRSCKHWTNDLGNTCVRVDLPPEVGVPWVNRFDREVDREWRRARAEGRLESREALAADVFLRLTSGENKADGRADIVFVIDLKAYRRGHAHPGEACHIIGGGPIPVDIVREMMRDAFVKAVLHDGVNIHTVKHFGRYRKAELQTALDLGAAPAFEGAVCEEEGCNRRYHLQWDHKDPVANGGPTCRDNLQGLCGHDHAKKTERDRKAGLLKRRPHGP